MTINLSDREMKVVNELAAEQELSQTAVMRSALRFYQLMHHRMKAGETMSFSGDPGRALKFTRSDFEAVDESPSNDIDQLTVLRDQFNIEGEADNWNLLARAIRRLREAPGGCFRADCSVFEIHVLKTRNAELVSAAKEMLLASSLYPADNNLKMCLSRLIDAIQATEVTQP